MKTTKKTALSAAFALALTLGLGACSDDDAETPAEPAVQETTDDGGDVDATGDDAGDSGTGDDTDDTDVTGGSEDPGDTGDVTAQALEAIGVAEEASGGVAYEIDDEEDEDGGWEVDVAVDDRSVEVVVDASGVVVRTDNDDLDEDDRAGLEAATISLSEAIELAIAEVGGYLDDVELEEEDGEHYWEVALDGTDQGDDVEVKVSVTGEIVDIDD